MNCTELEDLCSPTTFRALADPQRVVLLQRLANATEPQPVGEIAHCCGVHLSGVSRHLRMLSDAGLIRRQKIGREVFYSLDCAGFVEKLKGLTAALECCPANCCEAEEEGC